MKVLIDTNIVIDLLARRTPFYDDAAKIFSLADTKAIKLCVSALTFANTNYILSRELRPEEAKRILRKLKVLTTVLSLDEKVVDLSLNDKEFNDYEDSLQYFSAIENDIDIIITRNLKDFKKSKIPVMSPDQFLRSRK